MLERQYDAQGRLAGISVPALDYRVRYAYDAQGRLAAVGGPDMGSFTYHFEPGSDLLASVAGPVHTVRHAYEPHRDHLHVKANLWNREWTRMNANAGERRTSEDTGVTEDRRGGIGGVVSQYTYDVDPSGRRVGRDDLRPHLPPVAEAAKALAAQPIANEFSYNARSEVIGATMGTDRFAYDYDAIGNRMTSLATIAGRTTSRAYTANALNQYTSLVPSVATDAKEAVSSAPSTTTKHQTHRRRRLRRRTISTATCSPTPAVPSSPGTTRTG